MALTRIYLIRHGATILTAEDRFAGATNVPLSDEGRAQASHLAQRLKGLPVAAVYWHGCLVAASTVQSTLMHHN